MRDTFRRIRWDHPKFVVYGFYTALALAIAGVVLVILGVFGPLSQPFITLRNHSRETLLIEINGVYGVDGKRNSEPIYVKINPDATERVTLP